MPGKSEADVDHQGRPYPNVENAVRQDYIAEGEPYPGGIRGWLFGRKIITVLLGGSKHPTTQKIYGTWVEGVRSVFEAWATVAFATPANILQAMWRFFWSGNSMDANTIVTDTDVSVVSSAALVHTCPASSADKVTAAYGSNADRAPKFVLAYTPNGGTATIFTPTAGGVQGISNVVLGGVAEGSGVGGQGSLNGPLWMQVGDALELADANFVAADVMRKEIIFERYAL